MLIEHRETWFTIVRHGLKSTAEKHKTNHACQRTVCLYVRNKIIPQAHVLTEAFSTLYSQPGVVKTLKNVTDDIISYVDLIMAK
ncbi:hypothetical protein MHIR_DE00295 [Candidatus Doolittlea endobia]|uniref:Uncharacterized protein n=1 Tax=Candidatus Doolittlea endobia TaxID=1778262 RepID=A0A143WUN6_9ENTR|nr:hypothetical protein MHIR_DE00295 [Candidatus Doolittlea endobia]